MIENYAVLDDRFYVYAACILSSLGSMGLLYDEHPLAPWTEMIRCLVALGLTVKHGLVIDTAAAHLFLLAARLFYFYSAWIFKNECVDIFTRLTPLAEKES